MPMSSDLSAQRWFVSGSALIGCATGYLLAFSRSPVVGVALPLIFGLAGSAGGIYIAKADLTSEKGRQRLSLFGQSIVALTATMIVVSAVILGFLYWFEGPHDDTGLAALPTADGLTSADLAVLTVIRSRLQGLGASKNEQTTILQNAVKFDASSVVAMKLRAIWTTGEAALKSLSTTLSALTNTKPLQGPNDSINKSTDAKLPQRSDDGINNSIAPFVNLQSILAGTQPLLKNWIDDLGASKGGPTSEASEAIIGSLRRIQDLLSSILADSLVILAPYPDLVQSLLSLQATISSNCPLLMQKQITALAELWPDDDSSATRPLPRSSQSPGFVFHKLYVPRPSTCGD
jgi:hypothetical protein